MTVFIVIGIMMILMFMFLPQFSAARSGLLDGLGFDPDDFIPKKTIRYPESLDFETQRVVKVEPSGGVIDSWEYRAMAPTDIPDDGKIQDVISVGVSPVPQEGRPDIDNPGDDDVRMTWGGTDLASTYTITIDYHIRTYTHDWDLYDNSDYGVVADIDEAYVNQYVKAEWMIDANDDNIPDEIDDGFGNTISYRIDPYNPKIQELALDLAEGKDTAYGKAKAFYEYLHKNVDYPTRDQMNTDNPRYDFLPKYCTGPLADGRGDCDDQSITFISLCRAVGIPAWLELGYLFEQSAQKWGGHGWANVYLPLKDSERGYMIAPVDVVNSQFLFRGPYRFTDAVDTGGEGYLSYFYNTFSYTYSGSSRATFDDEFITGDMDESGSVIREVPDDTSYAGTGFLDSTDENGSTPGFTGAGVAVAVAVVIVALALLPLSGMSRRRRR